MLHKALLDFRQRIRGIAQLKAAMQKSDQRADVARSGPVAGMMDTSSQGSVKSETLSKQSPHGIGYCEAGLAFYGVRMNK